MSEAAVAIDSRLADAITQLSAAAPMCPIAMILLAGGFRLLAARRMKASFASYFHAEKKKKTNISVATQNTHYIYTNASVIITIISVYAPAV